MAARTTSSSWATGIVKSLELAGLDCAALFKQLGLDFAALQDPDARFPQDDMTRLWRLAVEQSGNPAIGLNMGKVVRPASFHVVGYVLMSSPTLATGFERLVRYQRIIAEGADVIFRRLPDCYLLISTRRPVTTHAPECRSLAGHGAGVVRLVDRASAAPDQSADPGRCTGRSEPLPRGVSRAAGIQRRP